MAAAKRAIAILLTVFLFVFTCFPGVASTVMPGRWEKLDSQRVGTRIVVMLKSGMRIEGKFAGCQHDNLRIETSEAEVILAKSDIHKVTKSGDSLNNGVLIGAVTGCIPFLLLGTKGT